MAPPPLPGSSRGRTSSAVVSHAARAMWTRCRASFRTPVSNSARHVPHTYGGNCRTPKRTWSVCSPAESYSTHAQEAARGHRILHLPSSLTPELHKSLPQAAKTPPSSSPCALAMAAPLPPEGLDEVKSPSRFAEEASKRDTPPLQRTAQHCHRWYGEVLISSRKKLAHSLCVPDYRGKCRVGTAVTSMTNDPPKRFNL